MNLDPVLLSRIQFAFTISFHILFPAFTIGLASWLAVLEALWLKTNNPRFKEIYLFWVKIFAVTFGMGVVSGVVLSYQIGTNWSRFSDSVGNVLGPLFGYEVLTAFFLEASFLGIMLFGWDRVSKKMHFISTLIVAIGTLISAFWILSANSWMHTPAGFEIRDNIFHPVDWLKIVFNPSFPFRFAHMTTAAYLTTAFVVGGVAGYYLLQKRYIEHAKIMLSMSMLMAIFVAPLQIFLGDRHGLNTVEYQPCKIAAIEGLWETQKGAPFIFFAIPDSDNETNKFAVEIPKVSSLLLTHQLEGEVLGLKHWSKENRPPVGPVFWAFRIMVAIGFLMALTGLIALILYFKKKLFSTRWFQAWCMMMTPTGFIAVLCGWMVTEIGRQPFIVYNEMYTKQAISPVLGEHILLSLLCFIVVYFFVFGAGTYYIIQLIKKGLVALKEKEEIYGEHGIIEPPLISDVVLNHP